MIDIKQYYKSSVRLDETVSAASFINGLVLHGTALNVIDVLSKDFTQTRQRCFTLTGPYGSGKSTIALFLSLLLSNNKNNRQLAENKLTSYTPETTFSIDLKVKKGWTVIKHVCGLEEPAQAIANSISEVTVGKRVKEGLSEAEYLTSIEEALKRPKTSDGTLILLDEMGKALDFQSREQRDLHFFQQLADLVQNAKHPVVMIGFLHQGFSEYSRSMTAQVQREWGKVQGRYRDINYSPTVDESLVLIGDSLDKSNKLQSTLTTRYGEITKLAGEKLAKKKDIFKYLQAALPLDPVVSLLLGPISRRSFSQNERSLFGFLASNEQLSFNRFVQEYYSSSKISDNQVLYDSNMFWDYLVQNLDHIISSSRDSQVWLEAKDAVYRSSLSGSKLHQSLTKLIALVTLFGYQHQIFCSREFISLYFEKLGYCVDDVTKAVRELEEWSVIIYRPNHSALCIFQGSDIDVNELISSTIDIIKDGVDWTKEIGFSHHILASAHYHETGTMRWIQTKVVSEKEAKGIDTQAAPLKSDEPFLSFLVPSSAAAETVLTEIASTNKRLVVGDCRSIESLKTYSLELIALSKILKEHKKIAHDRIAKQEINNRILATQRLLEQAHESVISNTQWIYGNTTYSHNDISSLASTFANLIFDSSPVIANELVNRSKPSGSANAAIKKLVHYMAESYDQPYLGMPENTFPAEKGLYYSCIKRFGLHQNIDDEYQFTLPSDPKLKALFEKTHQELVVKSNTIVWLSEIDAFWAAEPYGITKGIRTIWLMAYVLVHLKDYAFYDKDDTTGEIIFITQPDDEFALKLIQKSQNVAIQAVQIDQSKTAYLARLAEALDSVNISEESYGANITPLNVAEGMVTFFSRLSSWTVQTSELLPKARRFIEITRKASDPHQYLFEALPKIFGKSSEKITSPEVIDLLRNLKDAHREMLNNFEESLRYQLGTSLDKTTCSSVAGFTSDFKLKSFAQRLSEFGNRDNWVSNIISLLSSKSERNWDDLAIKKAKSELPELIEKFKLAAHRARFLDMDINAIKTQFSNQVLAIKASLNELTAEEQRAVFIAVMDDMEQKERLNGF